MSQHGLQSLAKIKGKSLYNYRLKKFVPREVLNIFITQILGFMTAKWVDEAAIDPILNYFADRQHTEKVLRDIENTVIKSKCFYCKRC